MKRIPFGKIAAAVCSFALAVGCLTGCTAQSTPLGERAVVRLVWLEKEEEHYRALTMVCDFTGEEQKQQVTVRSAQGDTVEQALRQAAGQRGGESFFAQNRLLLLGPQLAAEELPQLLEHFAANCGAYRDPALWLWYGGEEALSSLKDPMSFVQMAEELTQEDPLGCTAHVLESVGEDIVVLPILEMSEDGEGGVSGVRAGGLALPQDGALQVCREDAVLQGYGLLNGRQKEQLLTVEYAGGRYTLLLEELYRDIFCSEGRLCLTVRGACVPTDDPEAASVGVRNAAEQKVRQQCAAAWETLTQNGQRDVFALDWWGQQLGAKAGSAAAPVLEVSLHLE